MREDFDKVVRERGKTRGGHFVNNRKEHRDNNLPVEDQTRSSGCYYRYENILDGPISKYLTKHIGSKWDDVWSEICAANDIRSKPKPYIYQYIEHCVELNPYIDDRGRAWDCNGRREIYHRNFYVDINGILKPGTAHHKKKKKKDKPRKYVVLDELHQYHKIKDVWYLVTFAMWNEGISLDSNDILVRAENSDPQILAERSDAYNQRRYAAPVTQWTRYGANIYAVDKQQANKKEIRWIEAKLEEEIRRVEKKK